MIAGINGAEALILLVIILIVVGPDRLPHYASQLAKVIRKFRVLLTDAQEKVRDELDAQGEDIPWDKLDPRQYDPRRIVRDAMRDERPNSSKLGSATVAGAAATGTAIKVTQRDPGQPPPFDSEAT